MPAALTVASSVPRSTTGALGVSVFAFCPTTVAFDVVPLPLATLEYGTDGVTGAPEAARGENEAGDAGLVVVHRHVGRSPGWNSP